MLGAHLSMCFLYPRVLCRREVRVQDVTPVHRSGLLPRVSVPPFGPKEKRERDQGAPEVLLEILLYSGTMQKPSQSPA